MKCSLARNQVAGLIGFLTLIPAAHAEPPKIMTLRTQKVDDGVYFHVRFFAPEDFSFTMTDWYERYRTLHPKLTRLPRLVCQDDGAADAYPRVAREHYMIRVETLEFFGKAKGDRARFLLLYPTTGDKDEKTTLETALAERRRWKEVEVDLSFTADTRIKAARVARRAGVMPREDDLEGRWAVARADHFAVMEAQSPEFGFYGLARVLTGRAHNVPAAPFNFRASERADLRLYDLTTGTTAIAETLALDRMRNPGKGKFEARTIPVAKLPAIDVAEHDWVKMMAAKKPAAEPLADLVPHDNYYIHFKHYDKFLEMMDLVNELGTTVGRALSVQSREDHLKERIEEQLCLKNTGLAKLFGPAVIQGIAITGSDPYLREGSDITLLFKTKNKGLFLAGVKGHIDQARKKWGKELKEDKTNHGDDVIESFVTPLREVSLFRVILDDVVVYSNSLIAVQRVLDARDGKLMRLSESLDFQYMRTVFRHDDPAEDGFLFLSDPFVRNLVGPALRIKERRRLEALTTMYMINNGALLAAMETGKLPAEHKELLARTGLKDQELLMPEGTSARWDAARRTAISEAYNTIRFATPLIELPIERVTRREADEYEEFRLRYLGLWSRTFDPIGMRFSLRGKEIKWDTFVLPLVQVTQYNDLRRMTAGGRFKLDTGTFSDKTVVQFVAHISGDARKDILHLLTYLDGVPTKRCAGDWLSLRLDDTAVFKDFVEQQIIEDVGLKSPSYFSGAIFLDMPFTFGMEVTDPKVFMETWTRMLDRMKGDKFLVPKADWEMLKEPYKGTAFGKATVTIDRGRTLYFALIDDAWYLSLSEDSLKDLVDRSLLRKEGKLKGAKGEEIEANTVLYVAPGAMKKLKAGARLYLEYEAHRGAIANTYLWHPFYRSGLIGGKTTAAEKKDLALGLLGYVPMSADLAADHFDAARDEVVNKRHGSARKPILQEGVDAASPLGKLLDAFETIRADMRFREDGLHATVTLRRK